MYSHFTQAELLRITLLTRQCISAESHHDVRLAFDSLYSLIPFKAAGIGAVKRPDLWVNHSFDTSWTKMYLENRYNEVDPVLKIAARTSRPFTWAEARHCAGQNGQKIRCFLDHAQEEGVFNGIAVSSHGMDDYGSDTLVTLDMGRATLPRNWRVILQLFMAHIHDAAKRLCNPQLENSEASPLTPREIEALQWAKEGKSAWEIGKIMGISERTVKFHFSNIYAKLNVVNRAQAVALGVSHGLI